MVSWSTIFNLGQGVVVSPLGLRNPRFANDLLQGRDELPLLSVEFECVHASPAVSRLRARAGLDAGVEVVMLAPLRTDQTVDVLLLHIDIEGRLGTLLE